MERRRILVVGSAALVLLLSAALILYGGAGRGSRALKDSFTIEQLMSLPYADSAPVTAEEAKKKSVILDNANLSQPGYNLYCSTKSPEAYLMGMNGTVVHEWRLKNTTPIYREKIGCQSVEMDGQGNVYLVAKEKYLFKLDWDSNLVWHSDMMYHHDVYVAGNGDIYAIKYNVSSVVYDSKELPLLDDHLTILSPDGTIRREISVQDILGSRIGSTALNAIETKAAQQEPNKLGMDSVFDVFHTNSIKAAEKDIPGLCKKGDILISLRQLNIVAIIDPETGTKRWSWGMGALEAQHDARLLDNGHVLIFDNGVDRHYSRVVELDPLSRKIVWEYDGNRTFYSHSRGGAQRMPNGNTLITASDSGRAFEVTPNGTVVWDFYNADVTDNMRSAIFKLHRIDAETVERIMREKSQAG